MKKSIYLLLIFSLILQYGCSEKSLEELSVDPNNPTSVTPTLLLTAAQVDILGGFGYNWDRYAGAFVQTFAGNHATGVNADQYNLRSADFQGLYTSSYVNGLKDCYEIINTSGPAAEAWEHVGVAKIIMATGLGAITDVYGDIPYSEAFNISEFLNPSFDPQADIYTAINTLLTEAIQDLNTTSVLSLEGDLVHDNDVDKWKATAYLLLARNSNHLSKIDPQGSATAALGYVDMAKAAGMNSNDWNYSMKFDDQDPNWRNPWYELFENNLIIASENFMDMLISTDSGTWDPRLFSYWNSRNIEGTFVDIVGKQNGLPTGNSSFSPVGPQGYYGKIESPELIATYFELLFIEAEAALRANQPDRAATALNEAITSQINLVANAGVDHVAEYFDIDSATAQDAVDTRVSSYIATYANESAGTVTIEKIMTEKYKAMFTMNLETWVDVRRHDYQYPSYLALPANSILPQFIRRGLYPQSEIDNNSSTPSASMTDRLWWDAN